MACSQSSSGPPRKKVLLKSRKQVQDDRDTRPRGWLWGKQGKAGSEPKSAPDHPQAEPQEQKGEETPLARATGCSSAKRPQPESDPKGILCYPKAEPQKAEEIPAASATVRSTAKRPLPRSNPTSATCPPKSKVPATIVGKNSSSKCSWVQHRTTTTVICEDAGFSC